MFRGLFAAVLLLGAFGVQAAGRIDRGPGPDLALSIDERGSITFVGQTIEYVVTFRNGSAVTGPGAVVEATVPTGTRFSSAGGTPGWSCADAAVAGSVCTLAVGDVDFAGGVGRQVIFAVTVEPVHPADIVVTVAISDDGANGPDANPADNTATDVTPFGNDKVGQEVSIAATPSPTANLNVGELLAIELEVRNGGGVGATDVTVFESVPLGTTFDAGGSTPGWSCGDGAPAGSPCRFAIGSLGPGSVQTLTIAVRVADAIPAGLTAIANRAEVRYAAGADDFDPSNDLVSVSVGLAPGIAPDLVIGKDEVGTSTAPGGRIDYILAVSNDGTKGATGVVLDEVVPEHTTFNASASTAGWDCPDGAAAGSTCRLNLGTLPGAGGSASIAFAVDVAAIVPAGVSAITNTATVSDDGANGPDANPSNNEATDVTPLPNTTTAPDLVIGKDEVGTSTAPGGRIDYILSVSNDGTQGSTGVLVEEVVPVHTTFNAGASTPGWSCSDGSPAGTSCRLDLGPLAGGGGVATVTFAVDVAGVLPAGVTAITNTASVSDDGSNGPDLNPSNNRAGDVTPLPDDGAAPDLVIGKDELGTSSVPGGRIEYILSVSNDGTQGATGVVVDEVVPAHTFFSASASTSGWDCPDGASGGSSCQLDLGSLAGGGGNATVAFVVDVAGVLPAGVTTIANTAVVLDDGANGPDLNPTNNSATDLTPLPDTEAAPDLVITKDEVGTSSVPGGRIDYILSVSNDGTQGATGVEIEETVPANTTFNGGVSTTGWDCADGSPAGTICRLSLGSLPGGGGGASVAFSVDVDAVLPAGLTAITNTATVADDGANGPDLNPSNNSATDMTPLPDTGAAPDLVVTKDEVGTSSVPGGRIDYILSVSNDGTQGATGVGLEETVPPNTTFNGAVSTTGWDCADGSPAGTTCRLNLGSLAGGGGGANVAFAVDVDAVLPAGVAAITNTATVADDGANGPDLNPSNNSATDMTPLPDTGAAPDLVITKDDGGVSTVPGGTVVYTLTLSNVGTQLATGVVVQEMVPEHTTFSAGASSPGWSCRNGAGAMSVCLFDLEAMPVRGPILELDFAVRVLDVLPANVSRVRNRATVSDDGANGPDLNPVNNSTGDSTPIDRRDLGPDLLITKDDGGVSATPGSTVVYSLGVANVGTAMSTGVVIREMVPDNTSFDVASSTPGWSCADGSGAGSECLLAIGKLGLRGPIQVVSFGVTIGDPLAPNVSRVRNRATIEDDGSNGPDLDPTNNAAGDSTPIDVSGLGPDLVLAKDDGGVTAIRGDLVVYELGVANVGTRLASGVTVGETVPDHTTFDASSSTPGWDCPDGSVSGTNCALAVGALAPGGAGRVVVFAVRVDSSTPSSVDEIVNVANIFDDGTNGNDLDPSNNMDGETTPLLDSGPGPDLVLTLLGFSRPISEGEPLRGTLVLVNVGSRRSTGMVIRMTVPDGTRWATPSSARWDCPVGTPAGTVCEVEMGALRPHEAEYATGFILDVIAGGAPGGVVEMDALVYDDGVHGPDEFPADNVATGTVSVEQ